MSLSGGNDSAKGVQNTASRFERPTRLLPVAILVVALILRVVFSIQYASSPFHAYLTTDEEFEERWAWSIASRAPGPYEGIPYYRSPGYAYFGAAAYSLFGRSVTALRVLQVLIGVATVWVFLWAGTKWLDRKTGIAAAAISAIYAPFIVYTDCIVKETIVIFLTVLLIGLMFDALRTFSRRVWCLCGLVCGLTMIFRGNGVLFAPVFAIALLRGLSKPHLRRNAILAAAGFCLCAVAPVLPVTARNFLVANGDFVIVRWDGGPNLFFGNSPASSGAGAAGAGVSTDPWTEHLDVLREAEVALGRKVKASEASAYFAGKALHFIKTEPLRWARRIPRKLLCYLNAVELPDPIDITGAARYASVLRLPLAGYALVISLGLAGLIANPGRKGERFAMPLLYVLNLAVVLMFYVTARYRFPSIPILILSSGGLLVSIPEMIRFDKFERLALAAGVAMMVFLIARMPYVKVPPALHEELAGRVYIRHEQWAPAAEHFSVVCKARPNEDEPYLILARCFYELGREQDAVAVLRTGLERCDRRNRIQTMLDKLNSAQGGFMP